MTTKQLTKDFIKRDNRNYDMLMEYINECEENYSHIALKFSADEIKKMMMSVYSK